MNTSNLFGSFFFFGFVIAIFYGVGHLLHYNMGNITDWIFGVASFFWLMIIVTIPWNMHFKAKEILAEAKQSKDLEIAVREDDVNYAQSIAKRYLRIAILLHILSAVTFYALAYFQVSSLGYWSSVAALLLTILRPSIRLHDYIVSRLQMIREQIHYPREDVNKLKTKVYEMESNLKMLMERMDLSNENSEQSQLNKNIEHLKKNMHKSKVDLENFKVENQVAHDRLKKQSEEAITTLSEDARFLNQVRELIRFVKSS